jgi:hypothetical protein
MDRFRQFLMSCLIAASVLPSVLMAAADEDDETKPWLEEEIDLPPAPAADSLLPFHVSAAADHRYFVDGASLAVGKDGVVRYVVVVEAAGGGRTVNFEGMRCSAREFRNYASGRRDGSWSKARNSVWKPVRGLAPNSYHPALFWEYFCPGGEVVRSAEQARDLLRRGGHTQNRGLI